jgi:hypothetical protein
MGGHKVDKVQGVAILCMHNVLDSSRSSSAITVAGSSNRSQRQA